MKDLKKAPLMITYNEHKGKLRLDLDHFLQNEGISYQRPLFTEKKII